MNDDYFIHRDDCVIIRADSPWTDVRVEGCAVLVDREEGTALLTVPESWTDEQIWTALSFANTTHKYGVKYGRMLAKTEIREALGLER